MTTATKTIESLRTTAQRVKTNAPQRFGEAASVGDDYRQGDVYITYLGETAPGGLKKSKSVRAQLAPGTTQGSRHVLDSVEGVTEFSVPNATEFDGPVLLLEVERTVTHPEHGHVTLAPGCYGVTYQRTEDAERRRARVQD